MELSADGKALFVFADGRVLKIDPESGKSEPVAIGGEMVLDQTAEKAYMYDHMWRQMKQKMLVADLYGADWDSYLRRLPEVPALHRQQLRLRRDGQRAAGRDERLAHGLLLSRRSGPPTADATAALGLFLDYDFAGPGLKVAEIISGGPLDKADLKIRAGHVIEKIDGQALDRTVDHYKLLNRKAGQLDPAVRARSGLREPLGGDRSSRSPSARRTACSTGAGSATAGPRSTACPAAASATSTSRA